MRKEMRELTAHFLIQTKAVQLNSKNPFKLASGNSSPIYINCRKLMSDPLIMEHITFFFRATALDLGFSPQVIAGGESAGIPFASFLAQSMKLPLSYVRKAPKGYGMPDTLIEGASVLYSKVLLVEDIITDGGSKLHFIEALRKEEAQVEHCFVVLDRLQGGLEELLHHNVKLLALTDMNCLLDALLKVKVPGEELQSLRLYLKNPKEWNESKGLKWVEKQGCL